MKLARYLGGGHIEIRDEPAPLCPEGGVLIRTIASGLCSGELMDWYMDQKVPHVLGHEVCGEVFESQSPDFPVGALVAPHHHANCGECDWCRSGREVHCRQWKATKLNPGGMAEAVAISEKNLMDTHHVGHIRPRDAALMEPLACVAKSIRVSGISSGDAKVAVVGLGAMGLMHCLALSCPGIEISEKRRKWAQLAGLNALIPSDATTFDALFCCPGSQDALDWCVDHLNPGGKLILFSPLPPGQKLNLDAAAIYFKEIQVIPSYSCSLQDMLLAKSWLESGVLKAEQIVSDFIKLDELPIAYAKMKAGEIVKAMVMFD